MNNKVLPAIFLLIIFAIFLAGLKLQNLSAKKNPQSSPQPSVSASKTTVLGESTMLDLTKEGVVLGAKDSKVIVVEFSDPSCPFCAAAAGADNVLGKDENGRDIKIISDYLQKKFPGWQAPGPELERLAKEGKILLVFRYFPGHGSGEKAMMAAWCAEDQKKEIFWDFLRNLFKSQSLLGDENTWMQIAKNLGLDSQTIKSCVDSGKYQEKLQKDAEAGRQAASQIEGSQGFGTPSFFINGRLVVGAQSFTDLEKIINMELQ
jgi:protein-disulfide isomerase